MSRLSLPPLNVGRSPLPPLNVGSSTLNVGRSLALFPRLSPSPFLRLHPPLPSSRPAQRLPLSDGLPRECPRPLHGGRPPRLLPPRCLRARGLGRRPQPRQHRPHPPGSAQPRLRGTRLPSRQGLHPVDRLPGRRRRHEAPRHGRLREASHPKPISLESISASVPSGVPAATPTTTCSWVDTWRTVRANVPMSVEHIAPLAEGRDERWEIRHEIPLADPQG